MSQNPGLKVPAPSTCHPEVRRAIQQIIQKLGLTSSPKFGSITLDTPLGVPSGGTGKNSLTDKSLLVGNGTDALVELGVATNGQLPIGSTGADPVLATLTGTLNRVTVSNGSGSITLSGPQDYHTGASPEFVAVTLSSVTEQIIGLLWSNTADNSLTIGNSAGGGNDDRGVQNVIFGTEAAYNLNSTTPPAGQSNAYIGYQSGYGATGGTDNTANAMVGIGYRTFYKVTSGSNCVAIGSRSLESLTTADSVIAIGALSGLNLTTGGGNVLLGYTAGRDITTGSENLFIGNAAGYAVTTSQNHVGVGSNSLRFLTTGSENTAVGRSSGYNYRGNYSCYFGRTAGGYQYDGNYNVAMGYQSGQGVFGSSNSLSYCTLIGALSGYSITTADYTTAVGYQAAYSTTSGTRNTSTGALSLYTNTTGDKNTAYGLQALYYNTTGSQNNAIGTSSMQNNTSGNKNNAMGHGALFENTTGHENSGMGHSSLYEVTTGYRNTAAGYHSGRNITTGYGNCAFGYFAIRDAGANNLNVGMGYLAGYRNAGGSNVFIGPYAGNNQTTISDALFVDNQDRASAANELTQSLIYGIFAATISGQSLLVNGRLKSSYGAYLGDGGTTDYTEVETDGTIKFNGAATVWKDINSGAFPSSASNREEFVDTSGTNTGIESYVLDEGDSVHGNFEIQHDYKEGSDFTFHLHWQGQNPPTGTDKVKFQLEYTLAARNSDAPAPITITVEVDYSDAYSFSVTSFSPISGTGVSIGDQFLFKLSRIAPSANSYAGKCILATVGIHYEIDTVGSRSIATK